MILLSNKKSFVLLGLFIGWLILSVPIWAKPPTQAFAPIWPDRGSVLYDFEHWVFPRDDANADFLVWLAKPKKAQAHADILYVLDGNAAIQLLDDTDVDHNQPLPFLVFIGYTNTVLFNGKARAYDDTPLVLSGQQSPEFGGADAFALWLKDTLQPDIKDNIQSPVCRQALWGHSYGGLFVLHLLFKHQDLFDVYFSADPALWWQNAAFVREYSGLVLNSPVALSVARGNARFFQRSHTPQTQAQQDAINMWLQTLGKTETLQLKLDDNDLSHGDVFRISLKRAFKKMQARPADLSCRSK